MKKLPRISFVYIPIVAILLLAPLFFDVYVLYTLNTIFIGIILAIGLNIVLGYTGQISLCHAAFYGAGAYTTALLMAKLSWPFWLSVPVGAFFAALLGVMIGIPVLRLNGPYLALVTLSFGEIFQLIITHWDKLTQGPLGLVVPPASFGSLILNSDSKLFYLTSSVCILLVLLARNIISSKTGRAFMALRESQIAAQTVGINLAYFKVIAFALSAFYAGMAGGLFACVGHLVDPLDFGLMQSITFLTMVVIGGLGSIAGSVIGAAVIVLLPELLGGLQAYQELAYGVLLLLFLIFMPNGIYGSLKSTEIIYNWNQKWLKKENTV